MQLASKEGHCGFLQTDLIQSTPKLLGLSESLIISAIAAEVADNQLIETLIKGNTALILKSLYQAEVSVAKRLNYLLYGGSFHQKPAQQGLTQLI